MHKYVGVNTLEHSFEGPLLQNMHDKTKRKKLKLAW